MDIIILPELLKDFCKGQIESNTMQMNVIQLHSFMQQL